MILSVNIHSVFHLVSPADSQSPHTLPTFSAQNRKRPQLLVSADGISNVQERASMTWEKINTRLVQSRALIHKCTQEQRGTQLSARR